MSTDAWIGATKIAWKDGKMRTVRARMRSDPQRYRCNLFEGWVYNIVLK